MGMQSTAGTDCTPGEKPRVPRSRSAWPTDGCIVAASDYVKLLPDGTDHWTGRRVTRSAPTDSAAARDARRSGISSRSMPSTSCWQR